MSARHIAAGAIGGFLGMGAAVVVGALAGAADAPRQAGDRYKWFDPIVDVQSLIASRFVDEPDMEAMQRAALDAMIQALGDRYSEFIPAAMVAEFDKNTRGTYVGIGAEVRMQDCWLVIASPLEDSPAFKAGLMPEDRIKAINGESTCDLSLTECIARLTGEPNTPVTITVDRSGETFDLTIVRQKIETPTVKGVRYAGDGWDFFIDPTRKIAYLRLTQFSMASSRDLADTLRGLTKEGLNGLVLDLRFNPGGLLGAAIEISDLFLTEGVIVSTKGRSYSEQRAVARRQGTLPDFPMVVLINRNSASASEIVAGALSDNGRAIVVGERSFGKGSVQEVIPLPSGAGHLKLTEKYYYLPSGRSLHRKDDSTEWGVDPTEGFFVPMTDDEWREMTRLRRESEIIRVGNNGNAEDRWSDPAWILERLKDKQLAAAVEALQIKIDTGAWKPTGQQGDDGTLATEELRRNNEYRERLLRELARLDRQSATLGAAAGAGEAAATRRVVPEGAELEGGAIDIFDAQGNKVTTLRITGNDLNRWLFDAPVEPVKKDGE